MEGDEMKVEKIEIPTIAIGDKIIIWVWIAMTTFAALKFILQRDVFYGILAIWGHLISLFGYMQWRNIINTYFVQKTSEAMVGLSKAATLQQEQMGKIVDIIIGSWEQNETPDNRI